MVGIITGDIINSRKSNPGNWIKALRKVLHGYGKEPSQWEIYRGDSFQLEVEPAKALEAGILIKAVVKQTKEIDVRMAIGIGEKSYSSKKITESNGTAFINSGECLEKLKNQTLAIKTPWAALDEQINLVLKLALLTMDNWTPVSATIIKTALENPDLNQGNIAKVLKKSQSNISAGLKRGGYYEIVKMNEFYKKNIANKC